MTHGSAQTWLHRYAVLTAAATLALVGIGGVVTSRGVGMAVPDWPTTYGYNMFFFPFSKWVGGIFYEHSHRLVASIVGVLVVGLTRWLGGRPSRLPLALIGLGEVLGGLALLRLGPAWQGAGHFLSGIGGVVLLGAAVWARNEPAATPLPLLGWLAFWGVQIQGLLGGLRVVLYKDQLGIFHATLAQVFFVLMCALALITSRWWQSQRSSDSGFMGVAGNSALERPEARRGLDYVLFATTFLILAQLILGAAMRHQHAGLAIPDFPLAYGKVWPAMDAASVAFYNQQRLEVTAVNPITAGQIALQMAHRLLAGAIMGAVAVWAWRVRRQLAPGNPLGKMAVFWLGLILIQVLLGAATIWSKKAADIATAHVLVGALSLAVGALQCLIWLRQADESVSPAHHQPCPHPSPIIHHPSPQLP
ncbi:MAG TPA: COX15/CtaA family protein [Candidatus Binatia bacterium]|jgi:cytochrome c oxidase assembly protein subunit 15|nr:COX15/CtaA family protein [Candidatus Binatia bacterium]